MKTSFSNTKASKIVIPAAFGPIRAKAGIHERKYWIPAVKVLWTFAGMTSVVGTQTIKLVYLK
jgi:hypothetical protein